MSIEVNLPELGENVEGGTVIEVRVSVGDEVSEGQALLEVEAGKSAVEVPSPAAGKITEVLVHQGDEIQTNQLLFRMEAGAEQESSQEKAEKPPVKEKAPERSESDDEEDAEEAVEKEERAEEKKPVQSAARETPKPDGKATNGPTRRPGSVRPSPAVGMLESGLETPPPSPPPTPIDRLVPASPATRLLARELGIDIALVQGSAAHGRVTQEDIKAHVRKLASEGGTKTGLTAPPLPDFSQWGDVETKSFDTIRKETAKQMSLAWGLIPHVTQHDNADVTDLEEFRKTQSKNDVKITVTAFAMKAAAIALKQFPQVNSSLDVAHNRLIVKKFYHIGVAVDTERGLLVPVIRDVDKKSVQELAKELAEIAEKTRQRKVGVKDLSGGTFTITNLGGIGGTAFTPIVNYPEVAILGMSRGQWQPVIRDGQVIPRMLLPLSLSYDHRVIDGADAARFTRRIAELLENPLVMLLHA
jgi:pyruvate dehydrogenase E2 component (dihydrolipoamide acetyltransferase)